MSIKCWVPHLNLIFYNCFSSLSPRSKVNSCSVQLHGHLFMILMTWFIEIQMENRRINLFLAKTKKFSIFLSLFGSSKNFPRQVKVNKLIESIETWDKQRAERKRCAAESRRSAMIRIINWNVLQQSKTSAKLLQSVGCVRKMPPRGQ